MRLDALPQTDTPLAITWDECACLLCGGARQTPLLEADDSRGGLRFLVVRCDRCGLCFTNPRPDPVCIRRFYAADYPCHLAKERSARPDSLAKLLPMHGAARLLDFGCGAGDFLCRMDALGWNVTGLDCAEAPVARVRDLGLPAQVGTLPGALWHDACFEAITMWQSLEHVHQPLEVLHAAYRLLTPGGRLLVTVPNFDSFASRWFGSHWYGLDVPRHLTHFTPTTLRMMLGRAGFDEIELRQQSHHSWIRHSAELALRRGDGVGARFLKTRVGSALAGAWAKLSRRAESVLAIATK